MLQSGFLAIPKVQGSYGRGQNGAIDNDYVWGPKLDIGQTARTGTRKLNSLKMIAHFVL